jgi:hypothetical protein
MSAMGRLQADKDGSQLADCGPSAETAVSLLAWALNTYAVGPVC